MADMLPCHAVELSAARLIAFDNDGTLYPSGEAVGRAVLEAHRVYVEQHGLDVSTPDLQWVRQMIGKDAKEFYAAMLPDESLEVQRDFEEFCLDYEERAVREYPHLYAGAVELLGDLRDAGRILVLVTNGPPRYVRNVWDVTGLGRFFTASYPYGPPDYAGKGQRLRRAIEEWGDGPAVMIGDRASDREAAAEAGAGFIGASYGYGDLEELLPADAVVESLSGLYNLLLTPRERQR